MVFHLNEVYVDINHNRNNCSTRCRKCVLKQKKEEDLNEDLSQIVETTEAKSWDMPVLDGTSEVENLGFDLSKFPGWSAEQVQKYLDAGWTEDQLAEWYQQQVKENNA